MAGEELAGDDGAGKAGLGPVEAVFGAVAGERSLRLARCRCRRRLVGGDADVHLGGEAVGEEAGHGEPAAGVEQDADGVGDGGELDAFDGAGVGAVEGAGVLEVEGGGGALGDGVGEGDADGGVGGEALGVERLVRLASVSLVMLRPLLSSKVAVVRSSSAVKVTSAVAVRWLVAGSRSAVMT